MLKKALCSHAWQARFFSLFLVIVLSIMVGPWAHPAAAAPHSEVIVEKPASVQMTGSTIQKTALPEAVAQVDLRVGGGAYPGCMDLLETPVVDYKIDQLDLTGITLISTCGWQADESVKVTLMYPDGRLVTRDMKAVPAPNRKDIYQVSITFQPGVDAPEGKYRFTLQGSGVTIKTPVFFTKPSGAKLYAASQDSFTPVFQALGGKQRLRLEGFLPNEPVKLLVYRMERSVAKFYAWQNLKMDATGRLIVEANLPEIAQDGEVLFSAYGQETHSVQMERFSSAGVRISRQFDMDLYCPGAQTPRITSGNTIQSKSTSSLVSIHQQPGFGSRLTIQAPADSTLRVFDQPKCIDHAYWWKVSLSKPILFGWVAESFLGNYLVEPVK
jgi:hypothetical protein